MHKGNFHVSDVSQFQLQNYSNKLLGRQTRTYIMKLGRLKIVAHHGCATRRKNFDLKPLKTPYNDILEKKCPPCLPPLIRDLQVSLRFTFEILNYFSRKLVPSTNGN